MSIEAAIEALAPALQYTWSWDGPSRWEETLTAVEAALATLSPADHDALIEAALPRLAGWPRFTRGIPEGWRAPELLAQKDIDGGLIGGAALESRSFVELINAALAAK